MSQTATLMTKWTHHFTVLIVVLCTSGCSLLYVKPPPPPPPEPQPLVPWEVTCTRSMGMPILDFVFGGLIVASGISMLIEGESVRDNDFLNFGPPQNITVVDYTGPGVISLIGGGITIGSGVAGYGRVRTCRERNENAQHPSVPYRLTAPATAPGDNP